MASIRQQRVAEQIRLILSELFLRQMRDPRLQGLTITDVKIDRELSYADIYVHALGEDERQSEVIEALEKASRFLRREVAKSLTTRHIPVLRFHWDELLASSENIDQLLANLVIPDDEPEEGQ